MAAAANNSPSRDRHRERERHVVCLYKLGTLFQQREGGGGVCAGTDSCVGYCIASVCVAFARTVCQSK